ncbi:unnamed protein product [Calypogeia fissa]
MRPYPTVEILTAVLSDYSTVVLTAQVPLDGRFVFGAVGVSDGLWAVGPKRGKGTGWPGMRGGSYGPLPVTAPFTGAPARVQRVCLFLGRMERGIF